MKRNLEQVFNALVFVYFISNPARVGPGKAQSYIKFHYSIRSTMNFLKKRAKIMNLLCYNGPTQPPI
jgi:hypothetical protein